MVELGAEEGPPDDVRVVSGDVDDDLRQCVERAVAEGRFPYRPDHLGRAFLDRVDFEATGRWRPLWFWRIRPRALAYGMADLDGDGGMVAARATMAAWDKPFLQPVVQLTAESGERRDEDEWEVTALAGFGFARGTVEAALTAGMGRGEVGERAPSAWVFPVELWLARRGDGLGFEVWARTTMSAADERRDGSEHAVLGATALSLGVAATAPLSRWLRAAVGIRYDERLQDGLAGVWFGLEGRLPRF